MQVVARVGIHDAQLEVGDEIGNHSRKRQIVHDGTAFLFADGVASVNRYQRHLQHGEGNHSNGSRSGKAKNLWVFNRK